MVITIQKLYSIFVLLFWGLIGGITPSMLFAQITSNNFTVETHYWGKEEGLPSWQIYCQYQDENGLMWLGTNVGLSSFDGSEFKNRHLVSGNGKYVSDIVEDIHGNLWFLEVENAIGDTKIKILDRTNKEVKTLEQYLNIEVLDYKDKVWFLKRDKEKLYFWNREVEVFSYDGTWRVESFPPINGTMQIYSTSDQHFWVEFSRKIKFLESSSTEEKYINYVKLYHPEGTLLQSYSLDLTDNRGMLLKKDENGRLLGINWNKDSWEDYYFVHFSKEGDKKIYSEPFAGLNWMLNTGKNTNDYEHKKYFLINPNGIIGGVKKDSLLFFYEGKRIKEAGFSLQDEQFPLVNFYLDKSGAFWAATQKGLHKIDIWQSPFHKYLHHPVIHSIRGINMLENQELLVNSSLAQRK